MDQMAHHLVSGLAMLVTGLAPDLIVVVGEVTRLWERIGPIVNAVIQQRSFTHATTQVIASGPALLPWCCKSALVRQSLLNGFNLF